MHDVMMMMMMINDSEPNVQWLAACLLERYMLFLTLNLPCQNINYKLPTVLCISFVLLLVGHFLHGSKRTWVF